MLCQLDLREMTTRQRIERPIRELSGPVAQADNEQMLRDLRLESFDAEATDIDLSYAVNG